jgi:nucleotide-binding universal stress UspA family protein
MIARIVVGTDGSETATEAVRQAAELAGALGAELHILASYVTAMADVEQLKGDYSPGETAKTVLEAAAELGAAAGVEVVTHIGKADPADALLELSEEIDADLLVVGNRGMRSPKRFFLGSVPTTVASHAPCAVMIVKTT